MSSTVPLVHYLYTRLHQLGIESVHGVPSDYNLVSLDYLEAAGLKWIGDANELNAGYAADGYARIKGIGVIMTAFGVGELSAINAIAGSFAERVPVVLIVGSPSTKSQHEKQLLHHTLGNGDFSAFADIYRRVTVAQANLHDIDTATKMIDDTLRKCWIKRQPVYIELPTNMVTVEVDATPLEKFIDISRPQNPANEEQVIVSMILNRLYQARQPIFLIDGLVNRFGLEAEIERLIRKSGHPTFVTPMGKSSVDETLPNFQGVYAGAGSNAEVRKYVESSDLVLFFGPVKSDLNTTGFTYQLSTQNTIELHPKFTIVGNARYHLHFAGVIQGLTSRLDPTKLNITPTKPLTLESVSLPEVDEYPEGTITQSYLWPTLSTWLQPNDILLTETGTSCLGVWDTHLPSNTKLILQTLWGSIGYTLPAAQGAAITSRELGVPGRIILFEGDGSFQLTAQAIGTMIKLGIDIVIFLIENQGYTIERWVHGMDASYNDVVPWRYAEVPRAMGGSGENMKSYIVKTTRELEALWRTDEFQTPRGMKFVEMHMPKKDAPMSLKLVCESAAKTNRS